MATKGLEVVVRFPPGVSLALQGEFLLWAEKYLRNESGQDVRVVKDLMGDDSKLRRVMTLEARNKL